MRRDLSLTQVSDAVPWCHSSCRQPTSADESRAHVLGRPAWTPSDARSEGRNSARQTPRRSHIRTAHHRKNAEHCTAPSASAP
jgi:hypothetical protein